MCRKGCALVLYLKRKRLPNDMCGLANFDVPNEVGISIIFKLLLLSAREVKFH